MKKRLIIVSVELIDRAKLTRKMSASTKRSFTRVYFEEQDTDAKMVAALADKKQCSLFRPLVKDALEQVGITDEKFSWNELAGSLKGTRPGFICKAHKGHEVIVTYGTEDVLEEVKPEAKKVIEAPLAALVVEDAAPSLILEDLEANFKKIQAEVAAA